MSGRKALLSVAEVARARVLREQGSSYRAIGEQFGVSDRTVQRYLSGRVRPLCDDCGRPVNLKRDGTPERHWSNGVRCMPYDDPELAYEGDWVRDGLILRPAVTS